MVLTHELKPGGHTKKMLLQVDDLSKFQSNKGVNIS